MSVADQESPAPSLRRLPFTVRFSPQLVNKLISQRNKPSASAEISGLLFGLAEEGSVIAQAARKFEDGAGANGLAKRSEQDKLFEQQLSASQKHPETASLNLIGWYAIRKAGGLSASDLAYHDWYFPRPHDLALILTLEDPLNVSLELYCRTVAGLMTEEGHRVGLVRLSTAPLESALEVVPRPKIQDDFFMRAYELGEAEEGKPSGWKGTLAIKYRQVFSFLRPGSDGRDERAATEAKTEPPAEPLRGPAERPTSEPLLTAVPTKLAEPVTPALESARPEPPQTTIVPPKPALEQIKPAAEPVMAAPEAPKPVPKLPEPGAKLTEPAAKSEPVSQSASKSIEPGPKSIEKTPVSPSSKPVPETAVEGQWLQSTALQTVTKALSAVAFPGRHIVSSPAIAAPEVAEHRKPWALVLMIFVLTSVLTFAVGAYLRRMDALPSFLQVFAPPTGLGLKVEVQGDRLLLSWNRQNALVRHSREGVLSIEDGPQKRQVVLDASHVANGSILYHPNSDDVMFRLEVHGVNGDQATDSMRVLEATKPAALDLSQPPPASSPLRAQPRADVPKSDSSVPPVTGTQLGNGPKTKPAAPSSAKPTAPQARAEAPKSDVAKDEEVLATPEEAPPARPLVPPVDRMAPAATTPLRQLEPQPEVPKQMPPVSSSESLASYQPPKPVRQVLPSISSLPPGILTAAGHLEIIVRVDETGKVTDAKAVEGERKINSALVGSALAAARQWKFEPAVLRGKAVPSQHSIIFQFAARQ